MSAKVGLFRKLAKKHEKKFKKITNMGVEGTIKGRIHLIYIIYRETPPSPSARERSGYIWEGYGEVN